MSAVSSSMNRLRDRRMRNNYFTIRRISMTINVAFIGAGSIGFTRKIV